MAIKTVFRSILVILLLIYAGNGLYAQTTTAMYREAMNLRNQGKPLKAQRQFEAALEAARKSNDVPMQMKCHLELAELKTNVVNYKTAIEHYQAFTELYRQQRTKPHEKRKPGKKRRNRFIDHRATAI